MTKNILVFIILCASLANLYSQRKITASIQDIILTAQSESPSYLIAKSIRNNEYWRFVSSKSFLRPQIGLNATLPSLNRDISDIILPDGSRAFVSQANMFNQVGINLSQVISATGGTVTLGTGLSRLDLFKTDISDATTSYLSTPVSIGFTQPLMDFNPFKWNLKAAEINFESSKKKFVEDRENIAFNAMNLFFDLYVTNLTLKDAEDNKEYLDSIAVNAEGRYEVGRISETDLLQIQLSAKNADGNLAQLELNLQNKTEELRNFLGLEEVTFDLLPPSPITLYEVDLDRALESALKNRSLTEEFRLRQLNAERDVEEAQKSNGVNLSLNGSFGLTQSGATFSDAYSNLLDREQVNLSLYLPLADFGRAKAAREIAKSNLEVTQLQIDQDKISFEREITVNVEQFSLKRDQLKLAEEALDIAEKRKDIAKKRYNIGKIDVTNLNIAIQEEQGARQRYYQALWDLWRAHYTIRNLTLFDFENDLPLE